MADQKQKEVLELQVPTTFRSLIEGLVFAAKEPLTVKQIKDIYEGDGPQAFLRQLDVDEIEASISELNAEYEKAEKPYRIIQIAGGYQFATIPRYAEWIGRLYKEQGRRKLSQSGVETLAIVAYKQPVTKSDIESIRGVNCDYVLRTLLEKELVTIVGRAHAPGRPLLYGTTREFLKHFGLNDITDLPRPREIEEILGESQFETERRMLESQAGAEKMKEEEPDFKSRLPHIPKKKSELESPVEIKSKDNQRVIKTILKEESQEEIQKISPPDILHKEISAVEGLVVRDEETDLDVIRKDETVASVVEPTTVQAPEELGKADPIVDGAMINPEQLTGVEPQSAILEVPQEQLEEQSVEIPVSTDMETHVHDEPAREQKVIQDVRSVNPASNQNKSKWQSWKEKVQGFIRKIFG